MATGARDPHEAAGEAIERVVDDVVRCATCPSEVPDDWSSVEGWSVSEHSGQLVYLCPECGYHAAFPHLGR